MKKNTVHDTDIALKELQKLFGDGAEMIFSRNTLVQNQCILLLGAEIIAMLDKNMSLILGTSGMLLVKLSAASLLLSVLLFTFSSFNYYNFKMSILMFDADTDADVDDLKKVLKLFGSLGKYGVSFWRIGISAALISGTIFLFRV